MATALTITAVMAVISAVPAWSARATQLLPKGARLLAPFSERDGERGAIHVTHMMQRLVLAHVRLSLSNALALVKCALTGGSLDLLAPQVVVEALSAASQGQLWLPPIKPPWLALR